MPSDKFYFLQDYTNNNGTERRRIVGAAGGEDPLVVVEGPILASVQPMLPGMCVKARKPRGGNEVARASKGYSIPSSASN